MTAVLVSDHAPNSPEWHATRELGIGASEIAVVAGLSPYQSAFHLWHVKKGSIPRPDFLDVFRWGHLLEPLIAEEYARRHPEVGVATCGTYRSIDHDWQMANCDRLLIADDGAWVAPLEVKSSRFGDGFGRHGTDQIPLHYRCQVMQQMDVFGFDRAHLAVLIGGNDYREYIVEFDEGDARTLRAAGAAFWESLQNDDEPPIDCSESTYQAVRSMHPDIDGEDTELDPDVFMRYAQLKQGAEDAADDARQAKAQLLAAMGTARRALVNGVPVLRRQPDGKGGVALHTIKENAA